MHEARSLETLHWPQNCVRPIPTLSLLATGTRTMHTCIAFWACWLWICTIHNGNGCSPRRIRKEKLRPLQCSEHLRSTILEMDGAIVGLSTAEMPIPAIMRESMARVLDGRPSLTSVHVEKNMPIAATVKPKPCILIALRRFEQTPLRLPRTIPRRCRGQACTATDDEQRAVWMKLGSRIVAPAWRRWSRLPRSIRRRTVMQETLTDVEKQVLA